jgi:hypothetical protein
MCLRVKYFRGRTLFRHNVAQFVSFAANSGEQRFAWVRRFPQNHAFANRREAISKLFESNPDGMVNIRSFRPELDKGAPFSYGLKTVDEAYSCSSKLINDGWNLIVNETVNINDGGVSGVVFGDAIEFAPEDTPRCVEKAGCCRLPRQVGIQLLNTVYRFDLDVPNRPDGNRIEFSLHPIRRGFRDTHTIVWETERHHSQPSAPTPSWPNRFSGLMGDKAFGLLVAHSVGLPVPETTVIARRFAPFTFGTRTGTGEVWLRSAPNRQDPGRYSTHFGWRDPFEMMSAEDAESNVGGSESGVASTTVMSFLAQESVESQFSGAAATTKNGNTVVEGVGGFGSGFMLGRAPASSLPPDVAARVTELVESAVEFLGAIRMEWAFDGENVWVLQLHVGAASNEPDTIVDGPAKEWLEFDVKEGLPKLREQLTKHPSDVGIILVGDIGITSHFGDLLRGRRIPSRIHRK